MAGWEIENMPTNMLLDLWIGISTRKREEINALNHAAALLHERDAAAGKKAKTYTAKAAYPYKFEDEDKPQISKETKELAQRLAESGDLPPACAADLLKMQIITPFLVS